MDETKVKKIQKKFYVSSENSNLINKGLEEVSQVTQNNQSNVIENYVVLGLIRDLPDSPLRDELINVMNKKINIKRNEIEYFERVINKKD